jgi:hypothetical protein
MLSFDEFNELIGLAAVAEAEERYDPRRILLAPGTETDGA